ncbi:hypothetical protein J2S00_001813 [Caldalkalibacillus uzonensis]|uniref:YheC/YheD family protein n=1 Tax=Caldalkalibacillus uzonensis TaxID=353224 RepID=A0ABU0CSA1_9BACI|nr:YheC/YheD family protein [Caldalkalibacillus uzonensis]MDQ0339027.1 hypothetical protein [Caldalkalibacillus uzonensis]
MKAKTWIFFRMFQRIKESVKNLLFVVRLGHRAFDRSMTKPLIGIMVYKPRPLRDYEMAKLLNVDLLVFRPRGIKWSKNKIRGRIYKNGKWERKTCPFPAAVYNRLYSSNRTVVHKLERAIGKGKVFNCITRFDKWEIYNILRESAIHHYVLATYLYHPSNLIPLLKKYNKLILKPSKGQLGRRVYLIERTNNNEYRLYS